MAKSILNRLPVKYAQHVVESQRVHQYFEQLKPPNQDYRRNYHWMRLVSFLLYPRRLLRLLMLLFCQFLLESSDIVVAMLSFSETQ